MLKLIYTDKPHYYDYDVAINQPREVKTEVTIDDDSSLTEILKEVFELSRYMGYSKINPSRAYAIIDDLVADGAIDEDPEEKEYQINIKEVER